MGASGRYTALAVAVVIVAVAPALAVAERPTPRALALTPTPSPTPSLLPTPDVDWSIDVEPASPHVGETFKVTVAAFAPGGLALYRLNLLPIEDPTLEFKSEDGVNQNQMGVPASFLLNAVEEGENSFQVSVSFETTACDLPGMPGCVYYFVLVTSPVTTITVQPRPLIVGDVNCDAGIDSIDALFVLQYIADLLNAFDCEGAADANEDGVIDSIDASLILQVSAGLLSALPP